MKYHYLTAIFSCALAVSSCRESDPKVETSDPAVDLDPRISAVFLDESPGEAILVSEARRSATPGETLVIEGKIAGVMSPFTEGYASAVLSNETLRTCDLIPEDECPTPWDACCEAPEVISAQVMTMQISGDDGLPVAEGLKGVKGLKELDSLVVVGTVNESSTPENLILDLSGIFQKPAVLTEASAAE
ncbi:MAG: hypothetical protein AAF357_14645 [Verrucomicrobiota bacterium]